MKQGATSRKSKVTAEHRAEAARLKQLWDRKSPRPTQAEFGELYGIGNQSAVGQFLRGDAPLSLKAAKGFARGLGCKIADFSPRLAQEAQSLHEVMPQVRTGLSLVDLREMEQQLVLLYRDMSPDRQAELLQVANNFYAEAHPGPSQANPFPNATKEPVKET